MHSDHSVSKGEKWAQDEDEEGSMGRGGVEIGNQGDVDKQERRKYVTVEEIKKKEVKQWKRKYEKDEESGLCEHQSSNDRLEPIKYY